MPSRSTSHTSSYLGQDALSPLSQRGPPLQHSTSALSTNSQNHHSYHRPSCQEEECEHGLFSPHASPPSSSSSVRQPNTTHLSQYTPTHLGYAPEPSEAIEHTESGNGGAFGGRKAGETDFQHGLLGDAVADGLLGAGGGGDGDGPRAKFKGAAQGVSTTQWLARRHGIGRSRTMYVTLV